MKKMKNLLYIATLFMSMYSFSQVGIGTQTPSAKSILDLTATDKGFLLPRMSTSERTAIAPNATTDKGMQVYDTDTKSIWYWDGTTWVSTNAGDKTNDAFINNDTNTRVELGTNSDGTTARTTGTEFVIKDNGSVGIGTSSPDNSAILNLDVSSLPANGKKGFLGPKVGLTSNTDVTTIPSPAVGLMVYNEGTSGLTFEGYLF